MVTHDSLLPDQVILFEAMVAGVLDNPADASQRAQRAGHRLRQKFSPEGWLDAYEDLYKTLIASSRGLD